MKKIIFMLSLWSLSLFAASIPEVVSSNGCMECHNIQGKKSAPAFKGVAKRNIRQFPKSAKEKIKKTIKMGSSGRYPNFKDQVMPPYKHLSEKDLEEISSWILSLAR